MLFTDLLERSYVTTIENYAGEQIVYVSETIEADYAAVHSKILTTRGRRSALTIDFEGRQPFGPRSTWRWRT